MRLLISACVAVIVAGALHAQSPAADNLWHGEIQVADRATDPPDLVCPAGPRRRVTAAPPAKPSDAIPDASELQGVVPELPVGRPVTVDRALTAKFTRAADPERTEPFRIAIYGDSHVAAGTFGDELMRALRARGAEVDTSYFPATMGRAGVRLPIRKYCVASTWTLQAAYRSASEIVRTGRSLMNLVSTPGGSNYLWLDVRDAQRQSRVVRLQMHYVPNAGETAVGFVADDGTEKILRLPRAGGEQVTPGVVDVTAETTLSTLKLRVLYGTLILQGFSVQYRDPRPVTLDVFGVPSATARGWSRVDPGFFANSLNGASYDAVMLEYGTNEGSTANFDRDAYVAGLRQSLESFRRLFPDSACLLIGPTDRGVRVARSSKARKSAPRRPVDLLHYANVHHEIAQLQAEVGRDYNCAAWDWQAFMGGAGAMYRWALRSPTLAASDLIHLTPGGYRLSADAVAEAIGWGATPPPQP